MDFFQKQRASIIAKIGNEVYEALYGWLRSGMETTTKSDFKTPQTMKSGARTLPRSPQETDSDGNSDDDKRVPQMTPRERARQAMAALETTTVKQNDENDENVRQRLESQGNKLKANHLNALIMCQVGRDEMIPMQRIAAEIIRQSVDADFHSIFDVPYTNSSTVDMQGTMYLMALMIRLWDLNSAAVATQLQRIEEAILQWGIGDKDRHFDARRWAIVVQAERSAYEKIYELMSGTKDTMKSVHDLSIRILQFIGGFDTTHYYFAEQMIERIESSSIEYSLDDVLSKIVDHYDRMKRIGPVKHEPPVVKQSDGKDGKKKNDKPAVANPAISDGDASSITCQLCHMNHNASNCPMFQTLKQRDAVRRGELFPGKTDKESKGKGAKADQELESNEDADKKFCLVCSQLKHLPQGLAKTHTTANCKNLANFNRRVEEALDADSTPRIRREYGGQRLFSQRSYPDPSQSPSAQNMYYDAQAPYQTFMPSAFAIMTLLSMIEGSHRRKLQLNLKRKRFQPQ